MKDTEAESEDTSTFMLTARVPRELATALDRAAERLRVELRVPVSRTAALIRVLYEALAQDLRPAQKPILPPLPQATAPAPPVDVVVPKPAAPALVRPVPDTTQRFVPQEDVLRAGREQSIRKRYQKAKGSGIRVDTMLTEYLEKHGGEPSAKTGEPLKYEGVNKWSTGKGNWGASARKRLALAERLADEQGW